MSGAYLCGHMHAVVPAAVPAAVPAPSLSFSQHSQGADRSPHALRLMINVVNTFPPAAILWISERLPTPVLPAWHLKPLLPCMAAAAHADRCADYRRRRTLRIHTLGI